MVTSNLGSVTSSIIVGSFVVFPSSSIPSSARSTISPLFPGLEVVTVTMLLIKAVDADADHNIQTSPGMQRDLVSRIQKMK